jgi:hypothetical protein
MDAAEFTRALGVDAFRWFISSGPLTTLGSYPSFLLAVSLHASDSGHLRSFCSLLPIFDSAS